MDEFDKMIKQHNRAMKGFTGLFVFLAILSVALSCAAIYVVIHFLAKVW